VTPPELLQVLPGGPPGTSVPDPGRERTSDNWTEETLPVLR